MSYTRNAWWPRPGPAARCGEGAVLERSGPGGRGVGLRMLDILYGEHSESVADISNQGLSSYPRLPWLEKDIWVLNRRIKYIQGTCWHKEEGQPCSKP